MGRKGTKNRNTNNKKKIQSLSSTTTPIPQEPFSLLLKHPTQNKQTQNSLTLLQKSLKTLISTFRLRLNQSTTPYEVTFTSLPSEKIDKIDEMLSLLIIELTEILLNIFKPGQNLTLFLLESHKCIQSASQLLSPLSESGGVLKISKLSYYYTILKPAFESQSGLKYVSGLDSLHKDLLNFCSSFKDHNLLPLEKLVQLFHGNGVSKAFGKACAELSTDESSSSRASIDSEVEEFVIRLQNCEKVVNRGKPQVSQEWITLLRKRINQQH